jgi:glutamate-1-semialdehyde 2,1-aminomutase
MAGTDLELLDGLIADQEKVFLARTGESQRIRQECADVLPGGVASNWQDAPPGAVWIDHGAGSHVFDVDGTEYVDLHGGFGVGIVGHAHPPSWPPSPTGCARAPTSPSRPPTPVVVARELARRFGLPMWRFNNSGTESTMDAIHLMRTATGRPRIIKIEGSYHGHHDSVQVSVYPSADAAGPFARPNSVPVGTAVPKPVVALTVVVPFGDLAAGGAGARRAAGPDRRHDHRARHDEHRPDPAAARLPRKPARPAAPPRRLPRL